MDAKAAVREDIVEGLSDYLSPDPDVDPAEVFAIDLTDSGLEEADVVATSETLVVIPWAYQCVHTGPFLEIPPTYVRFELRGATFVNVADEDPDRWPHYRFIDYLCALHHIGVQTIVRPALTPPEYLGWAAARPH
jgi:hypothetical protein